VQLRAVWAAAVCLLLVAPAVAPAQKTPGQIQREIDRHNAKIGGHKAKERVLTSDISRQTDRIDDLQGDIDRLSARQRALQTSLDAKRAELARVQKQLRAERARLTRLKARLAVVRRTLAQRLVDLY
jgi:septal ring factor EnvC (AmiA/AmiB activator)